MLPHSALKAAVQQSVADRRWSITEHSIRFMRTPTTNCDMKSVDSAYDRLHNAIRTARMCRVIQFLLIPYLSSSAITETGRRSARHRRAESSGDSEILNRSWSWPAGPDVGSRRRVGPRSAVAIPRSTP